MFSGAITPAFFDADSFSPMPRRFIVFHYAAIFAMMPLLSLFASLLFSPLLHAFSMILFRRR
jgi:hypothetical protein